MTDEIYIRQDEEEVYTKKVKSIGDYCKKCFVETAEDCDDCLKRYDKKYGVRLQ